MVFFHSLCYAIKPKKIICGTVENNFYKAQDIICKFWTFENDMLACFETLSPYIVQAGLCPEFWDPSYFSLPGGGRL